MSLPCGCGSNSINWRTDMTEFEFDGECSLQPGTCPCGTTYYKRWAETALITEDGQTIEDYTI